MSVKELANIISPSLTEETLVDVIKTYSDFSNVKLLNVNIDKYSHKKGDAYLSSVSRFAVQGRGQNMLGIIEDVTIPVITKYFPKNIARQKTFRSVDFFKTEIIFYTKVWPELKSFKSVKIPDETDEIPLHLGSFSNGKTDFIMLEDLTGQGYASIGRSEVITKENITSCLEILANFHALSVAIKEEDPDFEELASGLEESYFAEKFRPWYENWMYQSMVPQIQKAVKDCLPKEYEAKISAFFSRDLYSDVIKDLQKHNKFSVVTQGDAWLPNFLVKKDNNGKFIGTKLIDFQLARYANLTNDLLHFLYMSLSEDLLINEWDNFIEKYHRFLTNRVEKLGVNKNVFTLSELTEEIKRRPLVGIAMAFESTTMSLLTDDEITELDMFEGEEAIPLEEVWIVPEFDKARNSKLAVLVKHMVDNGFI